MSMAKPTSRIASGMPQTTEAKFGSRSVRAMEHSKSQPPFLSQRIKVLFHLLPVISILMAKLT
jgi:hypothetical protein